MSKKRNLVFIYGSNSFAHSFKKHLEKYIDQVLLYNYNSNPIKEIQQYVPDIIYVNNVEKYHDTVIPFCNKLRNEPITDSIPVVIVGVEKQEDIQQGLKTGAVDVIQKPLQADTLALKVRNFFDIKEKLQNKNWLSLVNKTFDDSGLSDDEAFLKDITELISANIDNYKFSVSDLAFAANLSERQLYRRVKGLTNYTPAALIREMRLQRAYKLVKGRKIKTKKELANKVGYKSVNHFATAYKEQFNENIEF